MNNNLNEIAVANEQATSEVEITSFSEASRKTVEVSQGTVVPSYDEDPYDLTTLKSFLQRPYNVIEKDWASSNTISDKIIDLSLPSVLFKIKAIAYKLKNFRYFRGGLRIGIRINGTKFHYGKLLACWRPSHDESSLDKWNDNVYHASCYPHVTMSATENEVSELVVPYCLPWKYIDLDSGDNIDMGSLQIYVLNPLKIANDVPPTVSVSVFLNFEDVEIAGMTSFDLPVAQAAIKEARIKSERGLISGVMEGVSTIAGTLKTIPVISSTAGLVERAANGIGALAKSFGFCKPNDVSNWAPRILRNWNFAYSHGLENAPKMALDPENAITPAYELLGSHPEEMRLDHLFSTPALVAVYDWTDASKVVATIPMKPSLCFSKNGANVDGITGVIYSPTVLSWASMPFKYWRGSLKICIQVTCSAFHSGRLRVSWEPSVPFPTDSSDIYLNNGANRVNHVMDIQTETEFYATIPYLRNISWLRTDSDACNGYVAIEAINHLTHPEKPIPPVYINIWLAAGPDFQVAYPSQQPLDIEFYESPVAQGFTREQMRDVVYPPILKSTKLSIDDHLTMGEIVTHVKDVIMRPSQVLTRNVIDTNATNNTTVPIAGVIPNSLSLSYLQKYTDYYLPRSYLLHFMALYRYMRGSVTYKILVHDGSRTTLKGNVYTNGGPLKALNGYIRPTHYDGQIPEDVVADRHFNNTGIIAVNLQQTSNLEGTVPFYSQLYSMITTCSKTAKSRTSEPALFYYIEPEAYSTPVDTVFIPPVINIQASAGDDFIMGFQVGPPALFVPSNPFSSGCGNSSSMNQEKSNAISHV